MLPIFQEDFFSSMRRQLTRLLRYSTFGGTRFPYLQRQVLYYLVHETTNCSTTAVLDLRKDMLPISQEDFFSSMRRQLNRLLRYTISRRDMLPIFQENSRMGQTPYLSHETTTYSTTAVLDLWMGHDPYFSLVHEDDELNGYFGTRTG